MDLLETRFQVIPPGAAKALKRERLKAAGLVAFVAAAAAILFVIDPASSNLYPSCPFNALTGLYCPGCGTLRASHELLHLNPAAALRLNPVAVVSLPFLAYAFVSHAMLGIRGRELPGVFVPPRWIWTLLGTVLAFWVLRNIGLYPFSLMAPPI